MKLSRIYYSIKPMIPRWLQIALRRSSIMWRRKSYEHIWPINHASGQLPPGWSGWPGEKKFACVLTHDVETMRGVEQCHDLVQLERESGFCSSFNFVPHGYPVPADLRQHLTSSGFEVGVHDLRHDGKLYCSRESFEKNATRVNSYLHEWCSVGFRSGAMHHNLDWLQDLNIKYDASTFDVDPFEPQADGVGTIFPFWFQGSRRGYVELPYTLPQDFTLYVLMREKNIDLWKRKLDWIVSKGGMALVITHPDYMNFNGGKGRLDQYPAERYREFLDYIRTEYAGEYWNPLPGSMAEFWYDKYCPKQSSPYEENSHGASHATGESYVGTEWDRVAVNFVESQLPDRQPLNPPVRYPEPGVETPRKEWS